MLKARNLFTIIFIMLASTIFGQPSGLKSNKLIEQKGIVYSVCVFGRHPFLCVIDTSNQIKYYRLPIDFSQRESIAYDISDQNFYSISIFEIAPLQPSFSLIISQLNKFDTIVCLDTMATNKNLELYSPKSVSEKFEITPLRSAFFHSQIKNTGTVYFDLAITDDKQIKLFILENGEMSVWTIKDKQWLKLSNLKSSFNSKFITILSGNRIYLLSENGDLYRMGDEIIKIRENDIKSKLLFLIDKDESKVLFAESSNEMLLDLRQLFYKKRQLLINLKSE